ncbi:MAG: hypothetical protein ACK6DC_02670 [Planctomycetota bacterium]|jgi:hypothetical protein
MFLPITKPFRSTGCVILFAVSAFVTCDPSPAMGQEKPKEIAPAPAMNYSSETPAWLAFVANNSKSSGSSWWPSWKLPSWQMPRSKKSSTGWWSGTKSKSSYSKSNKTTMQKVSQTSKRWWSNTLEFLDPYAPPKERPASSRSEPSFFAKLFGGGEPEPKFNSVPEWASQPMP